MQELVREMHPWMKAYMETFHTDDAEVAKGIILKEIHTGYVTDNSVQLAKNLQLSPYDVALAEYIGLFHDIGRFRQYAIYKTFSDADSEDHALLGIRVMEEEGLLDRLDTTDADIVRFAIKNHNQMMIEPLMPTLENERRLLFAKIIRDADKLDIYRVLLPFLTPEGRKSAPKFLEREASELVSENFIRSFAAGKQADYRQLRTHGDRKIVRLMWVYDLNFDWTLREVVSRGYIDKFIASLEPQPGLAEGIDRLRSYIARRIGSKKI